MKKLVIGTGGHRFYPPDDLSHLNEAIQEASGALAGAFGGSYYLGNTVPALSGGTWTMAAGWMVYKGEVCAFDAQSVADVVGQSLVWEPLTSFRALDPLIYADASSQSPHVIKKVRLKFYASLPADYVLNTAMMTIGSALRNTTRPSFSTLLTLINGWGYSGIVPAYGRDAGGGLYVELRGVLDSASSTSNIFAVLPTGFRPMTAQYYPIIHAAGTTDSTWIKVDTNGELSVGATGSGLCNITGVKFPLV